MRNLDLIYRIEWLLSYKDEGEAGEYSFAEDESYLVIPPATFRKCYKQGLIEFFLSNPPKIIRHELYEIYRSDNRIVTVTTYSYKLSLYNLNKKELYVIYNTMKANCTHNGKPIYR